MSNFEVTDRRGSQKPEPAAEKQVIEVPAAEPQSRTWVGEIIYLLNLQPFKGQMIIVAQAAAKGSDGNPFIANYYMEQWQREGFDWRAKVKKRLDTFLTCGCRSHSPCADHKRMIGQWMVQDEQRLMLAASQPMPEVIEMLVRANQAREKARPDIFVPRG